LTPALLAGLPTQSQDGLVALARTRFTRLGTTCDRLSFGKLMLVVKPNTAIGWRRCLVLRRLANGHLCAPYRQHQVRRAVRPALLHRAVKRPSALMPSATHQFCLLRARLGLLMRIYPIAAMRPRLAPLSSIQQSSFSLLRFPIRTGGTNNDARQCHIHLHAGASGDEVLLIVQ